MICLDVHLNGVKVCRAGLGRHGLVHLNAAWHNPPPAWTPKGKRGRPQTSDSGSFVVSGVLYDRRPPVHENVSWTNGSLAVGDELRVRLVESSSPDEPVRRERSESIPDADTWEMIRARLDGCVRDLRRLGSAEAKRLARDLDSLSKKDRKVAAASRRR